MMRHHVERKPRDDRDGHRDEVGQRKGIPQLVLDQRWGVERQLIPATPRIFRCKRLLSSHAATSMNHNIGMGRDIEVGFKTQR